MEQHTARFTPEYVQIIEKFCAYITEKKNVPDMLEAFAVWANVEPDVCKQHFENFDDLQSDVWLYFFTQTLQAIEQQDVYHTYNVREKVLSFFYTWLEFLQPKREFVVFSVRQASWLGVLPPNLHAFRKAFTQYISDLLQLGQETGEIPRRAVIGDQQKYALFPAVLFILQFWSRDTSPEYQKTDAAVDKTVNLLFDLIGRNALDSSFDLVKFVFKNNKLFNFFSR